MCGEYDLHIGIQVTHQPHQLLLPFDVEETRFVHALQQQTAQKSAFPDLAPEALAEAYPGRNQSLTQVLSSADSRLNGLSRVTSRL